MSSDRDAFSGVLATDSPSLNGLLRRKSPNWEEPLRQGYAIAVELGGANEAPILRSPGVSFNPRPARIASLLLKEVPDPSLELLSAGLFSCLSEPSFEELADRELPPPLRAGLEFAREAAVRVPGPFDPQGSRIEAWLVRLAWRLDLVRHLHMTSLPLAEQRELCGLARADLCPSISSLQGNRLKELLAATIVRQERRIEGAAAAVQSTGRDIAE